jgi:hypothetical protein
MSCRSSRCRANRFILTSSGPGPERTGTIFGGATERTLQNGMSQNGSLHNGRLQTGTSQNGTLQNGSLHDGTTLQNVRGAKRCITEQYSYITEK